MCMHFLYYFKTDNLVQIHHRINDRKNLWFRQIWVASVLWHLLTDLAATCGVLWLRRMSENVGELLGLLEWLYM